MFIIQPPMFNNSCPIIEQTADGVPCGRCWFYMEDGFTCPRHGNVEEEVIKYILDKKVYFRK